MSTKAALPARPTGRRGRAALGMDAGPSSLPGGYYTYAYQSHVDCPSRDSPLYPFRQPIFVRNNPHPGRVRHMKGLLDVPICTVQDARTEGYRLLMSPPSGDRSLQFSRFNVPGNTRYSANRAKHLPAVGAVPVTYAWRDELEAMTKRIVDRAVDQSGRPSPRGCMSARGVQQSASLIDENRVLDLMCRILQTESVPAVQVWLNTATHSEKDIVMNMLRMATTGELAYTPPSNPATARPATSSGKPYRYHYHWEPAQSRIQTQQDPGERSSDADLSPPELPKHSSSRMGSRPSTTSGSLPRPLHTAEEATRRRTSAPSGQQRSVSTGERAVSVDRVPASASGGNRVKYVCKWNASSSQP